MEVGAPNDRIIHHEDWQTLPLRDFIGHVWASHQRGRQLPLPEFLDGYDFNETYRPEDVPMVIAYINHGRWVADCPGWCGNALVVSQADPYFICSECGSVENGGRWYLVVFPDEKNEIEEALLRRPERDGFRAWSRNWHPGESVERLKFENADMGV